MSETTTNNQDIILSQWQTCVEMANAVSDRRDNMNNLFVTVNLALSAAVSIVWNTKTIVLLSIGIIECIIWALFIRNYKHLNSAKYAVIADLEKKLPVSPFSKEWEIVKTRKKYIRSTNLEYALPVVFAVIYAALFFILKCE